MSNGWIERTLADLFEFSSGKAIAPSGEGKFPAYGSNGLIGCSPTSLFPSGIIIGRVGAYCGSVLLSKCPFWASDNTIVARPRDGIVDLGFGFYLLLHANLNSWAGGAAQPLLTQSVLKPLRFLLPALPTQRRIAAILGAYDDLIEVNRRRIAVLEEMARRLFEEWFVAFRFPGHDTTPLQDTPHGPLPQGWQVQPIGDVFEFLGGGTPSKTEPAYWDEGDVEWFTPSDLTGAKRTFMDRSSTRITEEGLRRSSAQLFPPFSVMMTSRATVGVIAINTAPATTNQGFITCLPNERVPLAFLLYWLRQNVPVFIAHATGATFKEITKGVFRRLPMAMPPADLVHRFEALCRPMLDQVLVHERSQERLAAARDLLLPRLISGELTVADAERTLETAA